MKKLIGLTIASAFVVLGLVGCGQKAATAPNTTAPVAKVQSDKDRAAAVVDAYLKADQFDYKNPASYHAGDKYLEKSFAEFHINDRKNLYQMTTDHKVVVTMSNINAQFRKQEGNKFTFEVREDESDYSDELGKVINTHKDHMAIVVNKESDGSFLISDIVSITGQQ